MQVKQYRERDLPERTVGREYPMEDEREAPFLGKVLSSRPVGPGLIEYEVEIPDDAGEKSLHFVDSDDTA